MNRAIAAEWRRLISVRSTGVLLGLTLLLGALVAWGNARRVGIEPTSAVAALLTSYTSVGVVLVSALGALAIGHEYRYGTVRLTFIAFPRRHPVLGAKLLVTAAATIATCVVATAIALGIGAIYGGFGGASASAALSLGVRTVVFMLCFLALGFALTALTRSIPVGIVVPFILATLVEPAVIALTGASWLERVLPFTNGTAALALDGSPWRGLGVFVLWVVAAVAVAWWSVLRRDA